MTLVEIMKNKEKLYSNTPFRRKGKSYCIRWSEEYGFLRTTSHKKYDTNNDEICRYNFLPEDFLVDDWEWVEEWYEGDFKKKYPNGVLCWVWGGFVNPFRAVVIDYKPSTHYFITENGCWLNAKPVKPEETPAIIKKE